ncbi:MAG TPA: PsiF family protein [Ramlibacter sp.]|nr:PsiF family protein [Ramlibacter sp.]
MKKLFSLMALGQALSVGSSYAAGHTGAVATAEDKERQAKVANCSSKTKGMKGEERRAFMRSCLSIDGKPPAQAKITICNVQAKGLKGDERSKFMSNCLK